MPVVLNKPNKMTCHVCGDAYSTLKRVRSNGNKITPAKYICTKCAKK